ncbi:MAG: group I truncated hemoglobin [Angustibacter sp.]
MELDAPEWGPGAGRKHQELARRWSLQAYVERGRRRRQAEQRAIYHGVLALLNLNGLSHDRLSYDELSQNGLSHDGRSLIDGTAGGTGMEASTASTGELSDGGVTLYDRLTRLAGSDEVFVQVTLRLYDRILGPVDRPDLADRILAPFFAGVDRARLERHMTAFLIHATGGPHRYTGRAMSAAHRLVGVTDAAFDRVLWHVTEVLRELGVPEVWIDEVGALVEPLRSSVVTSR